MRLLQAWESGVITTSVLLAAFALVALWETFRPARNFAVSTSRRWFANGSLFAIGQFAVPLALASSSIAAASYSAGSSRGLLHWVSAPAFLAVPVSVLSLDLCRYAQHFLYHRIAVLWRIHRVHHSDPGYDLTTGIRFHPIETLISQGTYLAFITVLGPPLYVVAVTEAASLAQNFLAHANVSFPRWAERALRPVLVTPDLHRVHHADDQLLQNCNFATLFPWWDRLFGTYMEATPQRFGLPEVSHRDALNPALLLAQPFLSLRGGEGVEYARKRTADANPGQAAN